VGHKHGSGVKSRMLMRPPKSEAEAEAEARDVA